MIHTHSYSLSGGAIWRYAAQSGAIRHYPMVLLGAIRRYPAALSGRYPSSLSDAIQCYPALSKHYPALSSIAIRCCTAVLSGATGGAIWHHYPVLSFAG
jgi:hypothetical protein